MRKSRFLLSLIAATAIGLSAVGCDSGSSGGIADTTDLSVPSNNDNVVERQSLREYMLVAQRGLNDGFTPEFGTGQSAPSGVITPVVAAPGDADGLDPAQLYELSGISDVPNPNANVTSPGDASSQNPTVPGDLVPEGSTGYHQIYPSPGGLFTIGMSRARNRGFAKDTVTTADLQLFALNIAEPLDVVFPPSIVFGATADSVSIRSFSPNQGEFVSGLWSSSGQQFYASIQNSIIVFAFDGTVGGLQESQIVAFPAGTGGTNNAVKLISSLNGAFVYAIDNANSQLITYSRNAGNGFLTQLATTAIPSDPRGMALDRSGKFLYVLGRTSAQLAGFQVGADGTLTPFDLFPDIAVGPIPFTFSSPLGDVATNPQFDTLYLSTYRGIVPGYSMNTSTGALTIVGAASQPLGSARNSANLEVEPTGRFLIGAFEHDFDAFQSFATPANGFPYDESLVFANTNSANNTTGIIYSATPNFDTLGRIVYVLPTATPETGQLQVYRIQNSGFPRPEEQIAVANPYGLGFFQKILQAPAGEGPVQP